MKKNVLISTISFVLAIMLVNVFAFASNKEINSSDNTYYLLGQIDKNNNNFKFIKDSSCVYAKGKDIVIYKNDINKIVARDKVLNIKKNEEEKNAYDYLVKQETVYNEAIKSGFSLSDNKVKQEIKKLRETTEKAVNYSDFTVYLSGRGISNDQYWEQEFNNIKRDCTINQYLDNLREKYAKEKNIKQWTNIDLNTWDTYKINFINNLIDNQNVELN